MKQLLRSLSILVLVAAVWACTEPTGSVGGRVSNRDEFHVPGPDLAASWTAKYPTAPNCTNGSTLGVNEIIIHGEVWEGFGSNGWIQYAKSPLEAQNERTVDIEVYSFQNFPAVRCRNTSKVLIWSFYDSPSQTPTHHLISYLNPQKNAVYFNPSAFTSVGDGNEILTSDGLWEIGRDHWVIKGYPRQLSDGSTVLDTLSDTLAVDVMIQWPAGCAPNGLDSPACRP